MRINLYRRFKNQKSAFCSGQATLGFVFLVAAIIIIVSVSFVFIIISLINSGYAYQATMQAGLAARSGVEDAMLQLNRNKDFASSGYSFAVGSATAFVSVASNTPAFGQVQITSLGKLGVQARRAQAVVSFNTSTAVMGILSWTETTQ